ncbi:Succinate dehydrogenase assembly factor 2 mitochondrial [Malassezia sp. CBS 17886]|nr:Succinate dehydrogenase assembly factor 2 mitochondrial [Malassezia sp. CBS 17886]
MSRVGVARKLQNVGRVRTGMCGVGGHLVRVAPTARCDGARGMRRCAGACAYHTSRRALDSAAGRPPLEDPFPLPLSRELDPVRRRAAALAEGVDLASSGQRVEGVSVPTRAKGRVDEARRVKLARLQYQCRKRGTLETDLILSTFAQRELVALGDAELDELDRLLDEPDWDIFYWCTERKPVPAPWAASFATEGRLGYRLRTHTRNEERATRRLPPLERTM